MGDVYRATDTCLDRDVALKVLRPSSSPIQTASSASCRRRVPRRRAGASHIAVIHDVGEDSGISFMAMELVHGGKLSGDRGEVVVDDAVQNSPQIAEALAAPTNRASFIAISSRPT